MLTKQKNRINWDKMMEFIKGEFHPLESDLEHALSDLQTVQPILSAQDYFPRFSLQFFPKGMIKGKLVDNLKVRFEWDLAYEIEKNDISLLSNQRKELKKNEQKISQIISELTKKYNLIAESGIVIMKKYIQGPGWYTLKPKWNNFRE